jgi:hypothetical protein
MTITIARVSGYVAAWGRQVLFGYRTLRQMVDAASRERDRTLPSNREDATMRLRSEPASGRRHLPTIPEVPRHLDGHQ